MYAKLAFRNVKRSMGDYAVYVFTLILSITLIFAYNSLLFSDAIKSFSELMKPMMGILLCVTGAVVLILGWLISYITRFIFEQRSREFACYLTMGDGTKKCFQAISPGASTYWKRDIGRWDYPWQFVLSGTEPGDFQFVWSGVCDGPFISASAIGLTIGCFC